MTPESKDVRAIEQWREHHRVLLCWSNAGVSNTQLLRKALLDPHFSVLLEARQAFGMERLEQEWAAIRGTPEGQAVADFTEDVVLHIFRGLYPGRGLKKVEGANPDVHAISS